MVFRRRMFGTIAAAGFSTGMALAVGTLPALASVTDTDLVPQVGSVQGLWHLDETSGSVAADSSGQDNDGIIHNAQLGQPGHTGTAFRFGAAGSWVEVPSSDSLNPGTSDFSISAWVKLSRAPASGETFDVIRKGLSTTKAGEYKVEIFSGGKVRCVAKDSARVTGSIYGPTTSVADGQWHQIGCVLNGSTWSVVVDNTVRSKTVNFGSISNTLDLAIGSKYGQEDYVDGLVDEVVVSIE